MFSKSNLFIMFYLIKVDSEFYTNRYKFTAARSCGDPGYVVNGRRVGNLFTFPNKVKFECLEGYKLQGLKERYCQANGEWSGTLPACVRK